MHKLHDQMAKRIAVEIFDAYGQAQPEKEVPSPDAQRMDLWYQTDRKPLDEPPPSYLRLPLRMAGQAAHFEFFSKVPDSDEVRDVHRKQLCWNQHRRVLAHRRKRPPPPLFPAWIITPGKPVACFLRRRVRRAKGWPEGFYWTDPDSEVWFVVVSELPRTRQTLALRLFGSERSRLQALEDIRRISDQDLELPKLLDVVAHLRTAVEHDKTIPIEERTPFMTAARAEHLRFAEQLRGEGRVEGLNEGRIEGINEGRVEEARTAVYDLCEVLKVPLRGPRRRQVEKMSLEELQVVRHHLKQHHDWPSES